MALRASDLSKKGKSGSTTNEVLIVQNTETNKASQFPLEDVFPILQSGSITSGGTLGSALAKTSPTALFVGGGFGSAVSGTDKNTLIFKGLRSNSDILKFKEETLSGNAQKGNVVLEIDQSEIDLDNCDNTRSLFLKQATLSNSAHVTGTLGVANGGTNAAALIDKAVLVSQASGTDTVRSLAMTTNGQLLIGGTSGPSVGTITGGTNVTVTNTDGGIELSATFSSLSSALDMSNNNIQMGTGWLSGDGDNEGILFNTVGQVFVGNSTPTSYFDDALNIGGGIKLGDSTGSNESISMRDTTSGTSGTLTISGSNASGTGNSGGRVTIEAGDGDTNGSGGRLTLAAGLRAGTGTDGSILMRTGSSGTITTAVTIDDNQDITVNAGSMIVETATEGIVHTGMATVTQSTSFTTGVTINATSGRITLHNSSTLAGDSTASFVVTNSTIQTDSIVLLTLLDKTGSGNSRMVATLGNQAAGSFTVLLHNMEASTSTSGLLLLNFLVINNSV